MNWRTQREWLDFSTWRYAHRRVMIAHPQSDGNTLKDAYKLGARLARFAARQGFNNYPGADASAVPYTWLIDPLRGTKGRALRCRLIRAVGGHGIPSCLYRVRNANR